MAIAGVWESWYLGSRRAPQRSTSRSANGWPEDLLGRCACGGESGASVESKDLKIEDRKWSASHLPQRGAFVGFAMSTGLRQGSFTTCKPGRAANGSRSRSRERAACAARTRDARLDKPSRTTAGL